MDVTKLQALYNGAVAMQNAAAALLAEVGGNPNPSVIPTPPVDLVEISTFAEIELDENRQAKHNYRIKHGLAARNFCVQKGAHKAAIDNSFALLLIFDRPDLYCVTAGTDAVGDAVKPIGNVGAPFIAQSAIDAYAYDANDSPGIRQAKYDAAGRPTNNANLPVVTGGSVYSISGEPSKQGGFSPAAPAIPTAVNIEQG